MNSRGDRDSIGKGQQSPKHLSQQQQQQQQQQRQVISSPSDLLQIKRVGESVGTSKRRRTEDAAVEGEGDDDIDR